MLQPEKKTHSENHWSKDKQQYKRFAKIQYSLKLAKKNYDSNQKLSD